MDSIRTSMIWMSFKFQVETFKPIQFEQIRQTLNRANLWTKIETQDQTALNVFEGFIKQTFLNPSIFWLNFRIENFDSSIQFERLSKETLFKELQKQTVAMEFDPWKF